MQTVERHTSLLLCRLHLSCVLIVHVTLFTYQQANLCFSPLRCVSSVCAPSGDHVLQPFEPELDWSQFSVSVPQSDIPRLHEVLAGVDDQTHTAMQVGCSFYDSGVS